MKPPFFTDVRVKSRVCLRLPTGHITKHQANFCGLRKLHADFEFVS